MRELSEKLQTAMQQLASTTQRLETVEHDARTWKEEAAIKIRSTLKS